MTSIKRSSIWLAVWTACASAQAEADADSVSNGQTNAQSNAQPTTTAAVQSIVITGNPLASQTLAQPASILTGEALLRRRASTLGETLDGLPGVAATWFGPNANRPVIRGLDGDRVRILDNASASVDASNLSFDHAVAQDPLVAERIEVLRGPAALLYGGSAQGGVVNTIDNRIPRTALDGLSGRAELRLGGAAFERSAAGLLEGGQDGLSWHVDGFKRATSDLAVPRFTPPDADGQPQAATTRVRNSAARGEGGALGASWADAGGYLGASIDTYRNHYGVVVEPDVTIQMRRDRLTLAGERAMDAGPVERLSLRLAHTRYGHDELEGDEVGTQFKSRGNDLRLELAHRPIGGVKGVWGVQVESLDFSALGAEAFVPTTASRSAALFAVEEAKLGAVTLTGGLRLEQARVRSDGDAADAPEPRFGPASERRFMPRSASLGAVWALAPGVVATGSVARTERAPAYYELYANGVHVATGAYERGSAQLGLERSHSAEAGLQWQQGPNLLRASVYAMRYAQFIALAASGATVEGLPEYRFTGVPARLWGAELELRQRMHLGGVDVDVSGGLDLTRGVDLASGQPLPRIAPVRLRLAAETAAAGWQWGGAIVRAAAQSRVPQADVATPGYTMLQFWVGRGWQVDGQELTVFARLDNALNALGYSATAVGSARTLAPLPGRGVQAGMQWRF